MAKADAFTFNLETLHHFDAAVTADFNAQLSGIVADCRKRPACNKDRTVTLKVKAVPSEADPDDVVLSLVIASTIPAAKHIIRKARSTPKNQLQLQFDQSDILDEDE